MEMVRLIEVTQWVILIFYKAKTQTLTSDSSKIILFEHHIVMKAFESLKEKKKEKKKKQKKGRAPEYKGLQNLFLTRCSFKYLQTNIVNWPMVI